MGVFSKEVTTMNDLFIQGLGSMYYAEQRILQALPQMIEKTTSSELRSAFENHLALAFVHYLTAYDRAFKT
jgi:ferritin-like metal-binding protein YciE